MASGQEAHEAYCQLLRDADQKMQESFDKLVIALSGGGFGLSLIILKDLIAGRAAVFPWVLYTAWAMWLVSLLCALASFHTSHRGIQALLRLHAKGPCNIHRNRWLDATSWLNVSAGLTCVIGAAAMAVFTMANFNARESSNGVQATEPVKTTNTAVAPAAESNSAPSGTRRPGGQGVRPSTPEMRPKQ